MYIWKKHWAEILSPRRSTILKRRISLGLVVFFLFSVNLQFKWISMIQARCMGVALSTTGTQDTQRQIQTCSKFYSLCVCVFFYKPNYWNWVILIWCCFLKLVVHRLSEVFAIDNPSAVKVILQWRTCLGPWGTKREETSMSQDPWRETTIVRGIYKEISLEGSQ